MKNMKLILLSLIFSATALAHAETVIELRIKDHKFIPARVEAPANVVFQLIVINEDPTFAEFESARMVIEKFVGPKKTLKLKVGPLKPGEYDFFEEFHATTAQGVLVAK